MPLSILTHVVVLAALIVIPLMATDVLPRPQSVMAFAAAPPAPPPPPAATPPPQVAAPNPTKAPVQAPPEIKPEPPPQPNYSLPGVVGIGVEGGIPGANTHGAVLASAPPPSTPIRVGGAIQEPKLLHKANPVYPAIAMTAKVQGVVVIDAVIAKDGSVKDARVVQSVPLLDQAALDAVRQWKYSPTLLNGVPVEVVFTVKVTFTLQ